MTTPAVHELDVLEPELRQVIDTAILQQPRSQQRMIGPSELGVSCVRCLVLKLSGVEERPEAAWLPYIGSAVHEFLARAFTEHELALVDKGLRRYHIEHRVTVGDIAGIPCQGNADLFDIELGAVIDWKIVGATTLRQARANGPSAQYRTQAHLYGRGFAHAGYQIRHVAIYYLPRGDVSLDDGYLWSEPYDEQIALDALGRADLYARAVTSLGVDTVLAQIPEHTGDGFTCRRFGYFPTTPTTTRQVLNLT